MILGNPRSPDESTHDVFTDYAQVVDGWMRMFLFAQGSGSAELSVNAGTAEPSGNEETGPSTNYPHSLSLDGPSSLER
jgi:hypothetical protein